MTEKVTYRTSPGFESGFWGTVLGTAGQFTGFKGLVKYGAFYTAFEAARLAGHPVVNEDIMWIADAVPFHIGHPFGIFLEHVNSISFSEAVLEAGGVFASGLLLNYIGSYLKDRGVRLNTKPL